MQDFCGLRHMGHNPCEQQGGIIGRSEGICQSNPDDQLSFNTSLKVDLSRIHATSDGWSLNSARDERRASAN